jgi:zinc finger protein ZFPM1
VEMLDINNQTQNSRKGEKRPLESDTHSNSLSPLPTAKIIPTLRLNTALASDPAANPDAKEILNFSMDKGEDLKIISSDNENVDHQEDAENVIESINISKVALSMHKLNASAGGKSKENINSVNQIMTKNLELTPRPNVFMCTPCGIRFSSLSTLEAHQTYYCSHRKDADENLPKSSDSTSDLNGEPPTKAIKTGKQYACSQCSYSAEKKVSLNRHMRMHQASPTPSSNASNGDETSSQMAVPQIVVPPSATTSSSTVLVPTQNIDRYCSDCDIRFSSTKTYRAHKQHYCSSRHQG